MSTYFVFVRLTLQVAKACFEKHAFDCDQGKVKLSSRYLFFNTIYIVYKVKFDLLFLHDYAPQIIDKCIHGVLGSHGFLQVPSIDRIYSTKSIDQAAPLEFIVIRWKRDEGYRAVAQKLSLGDFQGTFQMCMYIFLDICLLTL
jgi:hypothetical protein